MEEQQEEREGESAGGTLRAESEGDCVHVEWRVAGAAAGDWLGLFVHERRYDTHFLQRCETGGRAAGSATFRGLVRGHHDVRFFRAGAAVRAADVAPAVVCVGAVVALAVTRPTRRTLAVAWPPEHTDGQSWVALFRADERSNRQHRCVASRLLRDAETAAPAPRLLLPAPRAPGDYEVRFFHRGSMSLAAGNAYSGAARVHIACDDAMTAVFDAAHAACTVHWRAASVEPSAWQWLGVYDAPAPAGTRLTWEYVARHRYTSADHDEGVVVLTALPEPLRAWARTGTMPPEVARWELRFYNSYTAAAPPLFCRPFIAPPSS